MDGLFMYLFTVFTVIFLFPCIQGDNAQTLLSVKTGDPDYVIAHKDSGLALNCSVAYNASFGSPLFTWLKNGAPVEDSRRVQVLENGTLYIRRVLHRLKKDVSDQGMYRCIVELSGPGKVTGRDVKKVIVRDVKVDIAGIYKKFTIEPTPVTVPEGGVARFQCEIEAVPAAVYIWEKNKTFLPQNNNRYLVLSSGILQISGVRSEDAGLYRCYVTQGAPSNLSNRDGDGDNSDVGSKYSVEAELVVVKGSPVPVKLIASSESSPVTTRVGQPAILECLIQGVPGSVMWSKVKRDVQGSTMAVAVPIDHRRVDLYGNNLRFLQTTVADAGTYMCKAGNITTTMQLNVISKPVIVKIDPEGSVVKPKSHWVYVRCVVEGHPKPEIKWLRNGKEIEEGGPLYQINRLTEEEGSRLALVQAEVSNTGFHQCVATNEAGSASAFTYIEIYMKENAPNQVTNITVLQRTSTSLELAWKPPTQTSVLAYTVNYRNLRDDTKLDLVIPSEIIVLTDLMPFTNYSIYVVPFSSLGAGPNSDEVTISTLEDVPIRAPSVTLTPRGPTLLVQWTDLPVEDARGVITEFTLYVRRQGTANATEIVIKNGTIRSYLVEGLEPHTVYEVRMLAATVMGYPDRKHLQDLNLWAWVSVQTTNKDYSPAPKLQIVALNSSTLKAAWTVASHLAVRRFTVQLVRLPGDSIVHGPVELQSATTVYLFMGLEMNQLYAVKLGVELVTGATTHVVEEFNLSDLPQPPVPRNVRVTLRQATSLSVEWLLPDTQFEVRQYTVKYSLIGPSHEEEDGTDIMVTSDNPSALLDGLLPYSLYQISVRAELQGLQGPFSKPILEQTSEAVPTEPRDIKVMTVQPGQVSVAWQPPAQPNGRIMSYTVYYSSVPEKDEWLQVIRNGSQLSAMISFTEQEPHMYYIKIRASTSIGMGASTPLVPVNTSAISVTTGASTQQDSKTLGIIIGVCIGLFCIAICILVLALMRKKFFRMDRRGNHGQPPPEPQYIQSNGHIPSNGNGHAHHPGNLDGSFITGDYELDTYTPMLPENEQSDSKGGGTGNVILTPNGAKLNGFLPLKKNGLHNGRLNNGHMKSFGNPLYSEETKGLIAEMLSGSPRTSCLPVTMGDEGFTRSHCEDSGSLDNIDNSSTEGVLHDAPQGILCSDRAELDSGEGSWSYSSSDRNSTGYINSVPHSDMIDAGETIAFCGDSGVHVPAEGEGQGQMSEDRDGHFEGRGHNVSSQSQGDMRGYREVSSPSGGHRTVGNVGNFNSAVSDGRFPEQRTVSNVRGDGAVMSSFKPSVVTDRNGGSSHHGDPRHLTDQRMAHSQGGDAASPNKVIPQSTPTSVTGGDTSNHRGMDVRESGREVNHMSAASSLVQSDVGMSLRIPASPGIDNDQESHSLSADTTLPQLPQLRVSTSLSPSQAGCNRPESVRSGQGPHLTSPTSCVVSCNGSIPSSPTSHSSQNVRSDGGHDGSRRPHPEENHSNLRNGVLPHGRQKNRSVKSSAQGNIQGRTPVERSSSVQQVAPMAWISPSFVHGGVSTSESRRGESSREVTVHCERDTTKLPQETVLSGNRVISPSVLDAEM